MNIKKFLKALIPAQVYWRPRYYLFLKNLPKDRSGLILDCGCGEGIMLNYLRKKGYQVFGGDLDPDKLSVSGAKSVAVMDICALPFAGQKFSLAYALDVMETIPDIKAAFQEIRRVLKPEGRLIITVARSYSCSARLFSAQRSLRKIMPRFLWTRDFSGGRSWLELRVEEMSKHLSSLRTFSPESVRELCGDHFAIEKITHGFQLFTALATDLCYGVKGLHYFTAFLFYAAVRLDYCFFRNKPGYSLIITLKRK